MSLIGGAAVFSTLGFLAQQRGVAVPDVVKDGLSLAFVVYPEAITQMPLPWLWSFLFFFMLFLLGASTEIVLVDGLCACIYDQSRKARNNKWKVVIAWCLVFYVCGFVFSTRAGFSSVCAVVAELVVVMFVYGFRNVRDDIKQMFNRESNNESRQTAGYDDEEEDKPIDIRIIRHLLTTQELQQAILKDVIEKDFAESGEPKKLALSVRRLFEKILTSDEIGLIDGLGKYEKCCLLHVIGMKVPRKFRDKMKKQLVVDEKGYVRTIMIPGKERVTVYPKSHQSLTAKQATSQSMPAPNNTAQTTPTPDVISPVGTYLKIDVEKIKEKKVKNVVEDLYDFHRLVVIDKCQAVIDEYAKKLGSDSWTSNVHPDDFLRTMDTFYCMIHHASLSCTPGEREAKCSLEYLNQKLLEIFGNNGIELTMEGKRVWKEQLAKVDSYPYVQKASVSNIITFLINLV